MSVTLDKPHADPLVGGYNPLAGIVLAPDEVAFRTWGDLALFAPGHLRADPISHPAPTPSAMKGLSRAIYWKPEIEIEVRLIAVLAPIIYQDLSGYSIKTMNPRGESAPQSRVGLANVNYGVIIRIKPNSLRTKRTGASYAREMQRRMEAGQCYRQPCFGRREFTAYYEPSHPSLWTPQPINMDLGRMLLDFLPMGTGPNPFEREFDPIYFSARLVDGVLHVPENLYAAHRARQMEMRNKIHKPARAEVDAAEAQEFDDALANVLAAPAK